MEILVLFVYAVTILGKAGAVPVSESNRNHFILPNTFRFDERPSHPREVLCGSRTKLGEGDIVYFRNKGTSSRYIRNPRLSSLHLKGPPPLRAPPSGLIIPPFPHPYFNTFPSGARRWPKQHIRPRICHWTFQSVGSCQLVADFEHYEGGDLNCNRQYLLLSDEERELQVCGFMQFPGFFKSIGKFLQIKHLRKPQTWSADFEGYVTCTKNRVPEIIDLGFSSFEVEENEVDQIDTSIVAQSNDNLTVTSPIVSPIETANNSTGSDNFEQNGGIPFLNDELHAEVNSSSSGESPLKEYEDFLLAIIAPNIVTQTAEVPYTSQNESQTVPPNPKVNFTDDKYSDHLLSPTESVLNDHNFDLEEDAYFGYLQAPTESYVTKPEVTNPEAVEDSAGHGYLLDPSGSSGQDHVTEGSGSGSDSKDSEGQNSATVEETLETETKEEDESPEYGYLMEPTLAQGQGSSPPKRNKVNNRYLDARKKNSTEGIAYPENQGNDSSVPVSETGSGSAEDQIPAPYSRPQLLPDDAGSSVAAPGYSPATESATTEKSSDNYKPEEGNKETTVGEYTVPESTTPASHGYDGGEIAAENEPEEGYNETTVSDNTVPESATPAPYLNDEIAAENDVKPEVENYETTVGSDAVPETATPAPYVNDEIAAEKYVKPEMESENANVSEIAANSKNYATPTPQSYSEPEVKVEDASVNAIPDVAYSKPEANKSDEIASPPSEYSNPDVKEEAIEEPKIADAGQRQRKVTKADKSTQTDESYPPAKAAYVATSGGDKSVDLTPSSAGSSLDEVENVGLSSSATSDSDTPVHVKERDADSGLETVAAESAAISG